MDFIDPKELQEIHSQGMLMAPRKTFFKNRRDYPPSTPQKIAATPQRFPAGHAVHGLGRCRLSATTYATQTQRSFFVSRCVGVGSDKMLAPRWRP